MLPNNWVSMAIPLLSWPNMQRRGKRGNTLAKFSNSMGTLISQSNLNTFNSPDGSTSMLG
jgi:hypothetical protein